MIHLLKMKYLDLRGNRNRNDNRRLINYHFIIQPRSLEGHASRLVLINFGDTERIIDVTKFTNKFDDKLRVLVAGGETDYEKKLVVSLVLEKNL